ncbi:MAG: type II toxin-antitoxin system Phd/YefM family antitoxin [Notoacmeibacter sp.]|nr:type II toxin-antitoxin system Phd/YefM family antitoxin [Notoacmeibacter sp.]MCC0031912.1 type II toxin-antitoxin system Phd/YefM family antitoxin [Brucellaceae bacterium]
MSIVSQSDFRANLAKYLDQVESDRAELIVTRQGKPPVAVISLEELESWKETFHLLASPANARRLSRSIERLNAGRVTPKTAADLGLEDSDRADGN